MKYVSATDAKQGLAAVLDTAQREPVVIQRQKRDVAVVLSVQEYEKLTALSIADTFQTRAGIFNPFLYQQCSGSKPDPLKITAK